MQDVYCVISPTIYTYISLSHSLYISHLLEVQLPYDPACPLIGPFVINYRDEGGKFHAPVGALVLSRDHYQLEHSHKGMQRFTSTPLKGQFN